MYFDYHIHTDFSGDATFPMEEMVLGAIRNNAVEIAITDHLDLDYPDPNFDLVLRDYDTYKKTIYDLQLKYADQISILSGIEIGIQPHLGRELLDFIKTKSFDFIIGSVHCIDRVDLYEGRFCQGKTKEEAFQQFLEETLRDIKVFPYFNVLGHFDVIRRYCPYEDKSLLYDDYSDILDEIFKFLIYNGKGIEINTSGFKYGVKDPLPDIKALKRYKDLGGQIITVGSDAHTPDRVRDHFKEVEPYLREAGFDSIARFFGGTLSMVKF